MVSPSGRKHGTKIAFPTVPIGTQADLLKVINDHLGRVQDPPCVASRIASACSTLLLDHNGMDPTVREMFSLYTEIARSAATLRTKLHRANELRMYGHKFEEHYIDATLNEGSLCDIGIIGPVSLIGLHLGAEIERALLRNDGSNALKILEEFSRHAARQVAHQYPAQPGRLQSAKARFRKGNVEMRFADDLADIWCEESTQPLTGTVNRPFHHFIDACWSWATDSDPPSFDRPVKQAPKRRAERLAKAAKQRPKADPPG